MNAPDPEELLRRIALRKIHKDNYLAWVRSHMRRPRKKFKRHEPRGRR